MSLPHGSGPVTCSTQPDSAKKACPDAGDSHCATDYCRTIPPLPPPPPTSPMATMLSPAGRPSSSGSSGNPRVCSTLRKTHGTSWRLKLMAVSRTQRLAPAPLPACRPVRCTMPSTSVRPSRMMTTIRWLGPAGSPMSRPIGHKQCQGARQGSRQASSATQRQVQSSGRGRGGGGGGRDWAAVVMYKKPQGRGMAAQHDGHAKQRRRQALQLRVRPRHKAQLICIQ
jgi:hypothetical protein